MNPIVFFLAVTRPSSHVSSSLLLLVLGRKMPLGEEGLEVQTPGPPPPAPALGERVELADGAVLMGDMENKMTQLLSPSIFPLERDGLQTGKIISTGRVGKWGREAPGLRPHTSTHRPAWSPLSATHGLDTLRRAHHLSESVSSSIKWADEKPGLSFSLAFMKVTWISVFAK